MSMKIPHYVLKIYTDRSVCCCMVIEKYKKHVQSIQQKMDQYKSGTNLYMDAGFDLFTPHNLFTPHSNTIDSETFCNKIDHGIKCAMTFNKIPTAFYLYPRSSTGSKTPLRLSNSVGIIDSGYRGNIIALFDNFTESKYNVSSNDRLVQICGPNIMYPIYPVMVDSVEELGITSRGNK